MLLAMMAKFAEDHPDHEALDQHVILRVKAREDDGGELHVGGLREVTVDAGCTDMFALVLDADPGLDGDDEGDDESDDEGGASV
jgi:hypothetical protein